MQYLIDASVYVFRAYYSVPDDMVDDNGNPVNALYGFCRFIGDFMESVTPEYVAVLFDESMTECYRTEIYPAYKANRDPAPPELDFAQRIVAKYSNVPRADQASQLESVMEEEASASEQGPTSVHGVAPQEPATGRWDQTSVPSRAQLNAVYSAQSSAEAI